jgi:hypothetical protein
LMVTFSPIVSDSPGLRLRTSMTSSLRAW